MHCPKCNTKLKEDQTICPKCHKVLQLECPNCHSLGDSPLCVKCGYTILVKCAKCGKSVPTNKEKCKCGFLTATSLAYQECESDEFASIIINFGSLKLIKKQLNSQELYTKFFFRLKNLLFSQIKGVDCKFITYNDTFVINFNRELSLATSSNKAVRLALKILNAFVGLNANIIEEFSIPLNLSLTIIRKNAENLQDLTIYENNVKPLVIKKDSKKYLKGLQIILDQYVCDQLGKEYKVDSLYSQEEDGKVIVFYELIIEKFVLPPTSNKDNVDIKVIPQNINKNTVSSNEDDIYSFKFFDIKAKCSFLKTSATECIDTISNLDLSKQGKIIALRSLPEYSVSNFDLVQYYTKNDFRVLSVTCSEDLTYKPWGFFESIFREYFNLSPSNQFLNLASVPQNLLSLFKPLFDLLLCKPVNSMSSEDARYTYMDLWGKFLSILSNTVIIVDGFENIDDTSLQVLELYFDKYRSVKPNFVFITNKETSVHSKIKTLLRTTFYTEISLQKTTLESCLSILKSDATDFIQSFYYEKIKENFNGSYLYFKNAIEYLKDTGVLIDFENKLIIKNHKSVIIPKDLQGLYKSRIKYLSKNSDLSLIFAYSSMLGYRLDLKILKVLGVKDLEKNIGQIIDSKIARVENDILYINQYGQISSVVTASLKREAEMFLAKNIVAQLGKTMHDSSMALIMGRMSLYKDEYLMLWKNAQFAIKVGDFDSYLKNCLGFLSLVEHIESNISEEDIEENKKDVYNNILMCLYNYSPSKIYFIENILLMDAIEKGDDEKIVKLSNLMLQGALITSDYTNALGLLHNILSRMQQPTLETNGNINTKFLLLSLVHIEILYSIGNYRECVDIANKILNVLSADKIETVKPASFSTNLFVTHLLDTLRLAGFAKLFLMDADIEEFFVKVQNSLNAELPEKDCILAIKDFLAGKVYNTGNIEEYSAFSKTVFLILQEFSILKDDYKRFAQNIYQAKLLASDIHQKEIELFCDLLIGYAYSKIGIKSKALVIYNDVLEQAEKTAMFNILVLANYLIAKLGTTPEESLLLINDTLAYIRKNDNQAKIMYALLEKLYIDVVKAEGITSVDLETEVLKLEEFKTELVAILP